MRIMPLILCASDFRQLPGRILEKDAFLLYNKLVTGIGRGHFENFFISPVKGGIIAEAALQIHGGGWKPLLHQIVGQDAFLRADIGHHGGVELVLHLLLQRCIGHVKACADVVNAGDADQVAVDKGHDGTDLLVLLLRADFPEILIADQGNNDVEQIGQDKDAVLKGGLVVELVHLAKEGGQHGVLKVINGSQLLQGGLVVVRQVGIVKAYDDSLVQGGGVGIHIVEFSRLNDKQV